MCISLTMDMIKSYLIFQILCKTLWLYGLNYFEAIAYKSSGLFSEVIKPINITLEPEITSFVTKN